MQTFAPSLQLNTDLLKKGRNVYRAINHPLRQQMIHLIHSHHRMTVTEIYTQLKMEQSLASQHLAILRKERLLVTERRGKFIFYSVDYERIREVHEISRQLLTP